MKKFLALLLAASFFALPAEAAANKIVIAVQPTATAEDLQAQSKELEAALESKLSGTDVEILFPTSYAGVVEALNFGHAHAAFMGAWPAKLAEARAGATVGLAEIREVIVNGQKKHAPSYFSSWIVLKD